MSRRLAVLGCLACLTVQVTGSSAGATYDPLGSGATVLKLDKRFLSLLRSQGVKLSSREGAVVDGATLRFPVTGGRFDPVTRKGTVEHGGAVLFEGAGPPLSLKGLQLKTTRPSSPFVAKLGGGQLKLGRAQRLLVTRRGFAEEVQTSQVRLSAKFATRLSKRLRARRLFREGMLVGSAVTRANPATVAVLGKGRATLELDPAMAAKLDSLFVAVNPIFPAERPGPFTLPISGGKLAPDLAGGYLQLEGALELLQLGGGQLIWSAPILDIDTGSLRPEVEVKPSPPYAGKAGPLDIASLSLPPGSTAANPGRRTLAINGAPLAIAGSTAATLNEVFAKPQGKDNVFSAAEPLGRITLVAESQ
jgi:uncharacterized Zn-binding protein involved in type VI secretion